LLSQAQVEVCPALKSRVRKHFRLIFHSLFILNQEWKKPQSFNIYCPRKKKKRSKKDGL